MTKNCGNKAFDNFAITNMAKKFGNKVFGNFAITNMAKNVEIKYFYYKENVQIVIVMVEFQKLYLILIPAFSTVPPELKTT